MVSLKNYLMHRINAALNAPVVGLDISDRGMKYLRFHEAHGMLYPDAFGRKEIPEGVIMGGVIMREDELVRVLKEWAAHEGRALATSGFVVSLPEEKSFVRVIRIPNMKREEVGNAIRWELESNVPFKVDEISYSYEVVETGSKSADHLDVVVTAFPKAIVEAYVRVCTGAGLQPTALELESQAIIRSLAIQREDMAIRVVLDIGSSRTSITLVLGRFIIFTATIPLGGVLLEEQIAKGLKVAPTEAIRIKKTLGLDKRAYDGNLFAALAPSIAALTDEARRAIEYSGNYTHRLGVPSMLVVSVLLVGGDASLPGLDTYLASALEVVVTRHDPFLPLGSRLLGIVPPLIRTEALSFATVVGLALRPIDAILS
ncbi:MAG: type IV pilus assembly protein PilM [Candidatus Sungbacteria bacterium]|nr:type IV pilus assembly protein PilM [Candidatus Sungbacteria bacterium]